MSLKCLGFEACKENGQATEDRHTSVLNVAGTGFIMCKMSLHASRGIYLIQILKFKLIETITEFVKNLEVPPSCRNNLRFILRIHFWGNLREGIHSNLLIIKVAMKIIN